MKIIAVTLMMIFSFKTFAAPRLSFLETTTASGSFTAIQGGWGVTKTSNVSARVCHLFVSQHNENGKPVTDLHFQVMDSYSNSNNNVVIGRSRTLVTKSIAISSNGVAETVGGNEEIKTQVSYKNGILNYRSVNGVYNPWLGGKIAELEIEEFSARISPDFQQIGGVRLEWKSVVPTLGPVFLSNDENEILKSHTADSEGVVNCNQWRQQAN